MLLKKHHNIKWLHMLTCRKKWSWVYISVQVYIWSITVILELQVKDAELWVNRWLLPFKIVLDKKRPTEGWIILNLNKSQRLVDASKNTQNIRDKIKRVGLYLISLVFSHYSADVHFSHLPISVHLTVHDCKTVNGNTRCCNCVCSG